MRKKLIVILTIIIALIITIILLIINYRNLSKYSYSEEYYVYDNINTFKDIKYDKIVICLNYDDESKVCDKDKTLRVITNTKKINKLIKNMYSYKYDIDAGINLILDPVYYTAFFIKDNKISGTMYISFSNLYLTVGDHAYMFRHDDRLKIAFQLGLVLVSNFMI
ncbi:MAG: hypothetical protein K6C11_01845 [Bacilli bacterium]|nr:hypothetical protein [Bacilli bacterium]